MQDNNCKTLPEPVDAPAQLIMYKDISSQTDMSYIHTKQKSPWLHINMKKSAICIVIGYIFLCIITIVSTQIQTVIVYANFVRIPFGDLTNLKRFGLTSSRNIELETDDGFLLKGWHILPPGNVSVIASKVDKSSHHEFYDEELKKAKRIVIFFHGQAGNRGTRNRPPLMKRLSAEFSAHVIAIDYRGFGDSQGWPSESGTHLDTLATLQWLLLRLQNTSSLTRTTTTATSTTTCSGSYTLHNRNSFPPVYVYGQSLGSGVSTALLADMANRSSNVITGLILDAAFTSLPDASLTHPAGAIFRIVPGIKNIMLRSIKISYPNRKYLSHITVPVLLLHGQKDTLIPISHSRELYQVIQKSPTSSPLSRLVEIPEAGHITGYLSTEWLRGVSDFFTSIELELDSTITSASNITSTISSKDSED